MARVCPRWFPNKRHPDKPGFYLDDRLKLQIDVLLKNIKNDWDFTILITGQGEVRVGKSMIAMQIACYWAYMMEELYGIKVPFDLENNFVFEGRELISKGNRLGVNYPYSPLVFDEAGADLESRKIMSGSTQIVLDYFRECGQYNMLNVLVLPDFFDLPKGIALSRSIFLIDVFYLANDEGIFERGYFNFYSRRGKKLLYLLGKKDLNYSAVKSDFRKIPGHFKNFFTVDEGDYRQRKLAALKKREFGRRSTHMMERDALIYLLTREKQTRDIKKGERIFLRKDLSRRLEELTGISIGETTLFDAMKRVCVQLGESTSR
jgi:hypothetical protein